MADGLGESPVTPTIAETLLLSAHQALRAEVPGLTAATVDYQAYGCINELRVTTQGRQLEIVGG